MYEIDCCVRSNLRGRLNMNDLLKMFTSRSELRIPYMMRQLAGIFRLDYEENQKIVHVDGMPINVVTSVMSDKEA